ncbi:hypothetical protein Gorai_014471 [Gossypium raimondii]|uniref:CCHC-type domain-containing protein n=1 Tax=Gossypium raimondii TaxID=29730 RepID=A0A7J8P3W1_GOSRA|nr:hypothetical protein [Gossypium raimondii]
MPGTGSPIPTERARATKKVRNKAPSESNPGVQITGGEESVKESFKEKLMANSEQGNGKDVMLLNDDDFELLEGDVSASKEGAYPKSSFSDQPEFLYQREVLVEGDGLVSTSEMLYRYYTKVLLRAIEGMIGTIVKLDYNTTVGKRGKFARFRIVIDLNKPLLSQINIDGLQYNIKDEGLPKICYVCGCFGHLKENCVKQKVEAIKNLEVQPENGKGSKVVETSSNFGPWMQDTVVKEGNNDQRIDIGVVENIQRRKKGKGKIPQGSGLINVVTKDKPEV